MTILKKRFLPLFLATCIGAGTVSTCNAGWESLKFWNNATVKSCMTNCLSKLGFLKNKKVLITGGVVVACLVLVYFFNKIKGADKKVDEIIAELTRACKDNNIEKVREILDKNKSIKDFGKWIIFGGEYYSSKNVPNSPLLCACEKGDLEMVTLIVERLFEESKNKGGCYNGILNSLTMRDMSVFDFALRNKNKENADKIFKYLVEKFYKQLLKNIRLINNTKVNPICFACYNGRLDLVKWLVEDEKFSIESVHSDEIYFNMSPLNAAIESGNLDVVEYLLSKGAIKTFKESESFNIFGGLGRERPFFLAIKKRNKKIIKALSDEILKNKGLKPENYNLEDGEFVYIFKNKYTMEILKSDCGAKNIIDLGKHGKSNLVKFTLCNLE